MKRSFRGFISLALAACVAFSALAVASIYHVADTVITSCRAFKNLLVDNFMGMAFTDPFTPKATGYPQAKAYKARIEKRERPVLTNSWRMCPSI